MTAWPNAASWINNEREHGITLGTFCHGVRITILTLTPAQKKCRSKDSRDGAEHNIALIDKAVVNGFKFLHKGAVIKKAHQNVYFLRHPR